MLRDASSTASNLIDTAEMYNFGEAETLLGNSLKELNVKREEIVIATMLFWGPHVGGPMEHFEYYKKMGLNQSGVSRKHVIEGTRNCLKRL